MIMAHDARLKSACLYICRGVQDVGGTRLPIAMQAGKKRERQAGKQRDRQAGKQTDR